MEIGWRARPFPARPACERILGPPVTYRFGDCELDTERFELRRGGTRRHVEPQVFDVLAYLLAHRERVVTRDELLAQVWGHSYVAEATLSSRLMAVRKAVGDSGRAQSLIRTVRGRGYQFAGAVEEVVAAATAPLAPSARATPSVIGRDAQLGELRRLLRPRSPGRGSSCWSRARRGPARRRSSRPSSRRRRPATRRWWAGAAASSCADPPSRTCRCSRRSGASAAGLGGRTSWMSCRGLRPPGSSGCRRWPDRPTSRQLTSGRWEQARSACCARSSRRSMR